VDVIEAHARRLPAVDERWFPRAHTDEELTAGLLHGKVAGRAAHPLDNVRGNIELLLQADPDKRFGMSFVADAFDLDGVLGLVERASGAPIDRAARVGDVWIEPAPILAACARMGDRVAAAARRGETVLLATGHPTGLIVLYMQIAKLLTAGGAKVVHPADGVSWQDGSLGLRQIRYLEGVAMITDGAVPKHTHAPDAMERMLREITPDLVVADHGYAGAAIEAGIDTVSVADVNDPALIVAHALGRGEAVVVMDDNVSPDAYWPCFQAIAARFGPGAAVAGLA
jgi:hypothetical protein